MDKALATRTSAEKDLPKGRVGYEPAGVGRASGLCSSAMSLRSDPPEGRDDVLPPSHPQTAWPRTTLGRSGLAVSKIGLGSAYGLGEADVVRAFERGINYFYWGSYRKKSFGKGIRSVARRHRDEMVVVIQTYTRIARTMRRSLESALRQLDIDHADLLLLGWWNQPPPPAIVDAAVALVDAGRARGLVISCHHRPTFQQYIADHRFGAIMVRYNAAHPGAEAEVFPHLGADRPGVVTYTTTRWGSLIDPKNAIAGQPMPTATDCYRFSLSHPDIDVCLAGPANGIELDGALKALELGALDAEAMANMRAVGARVHDAPTPSGRALGFFDRWLMGGKPQGR